MKNTFLKYLLYFLLLIIAMTAALVGYLFYNKEEIKQEALTQINALFHTQIEAKRIGLNIFNNFPQIGLGLEEVLIQDAFNSNEPLLHAQKFFVGFDVWDMINKKYRIQTLRLEDGKINLFIHKNGKGNFMIFAANDTAASGPLMLYLQKVMLTNMDIRFEHKPLKQQYQALIRKANWKVDIGKDNWLFDMQNDMWVELIQFDKQKFVTGKKVGANLLLTYALEKDKWTFNQTDFLIDAFKFSANGSYQTGEKHDEISLQIQTGKLNITELMSVLPIKKDFMKDWESKGEVSLTGNIEGKIGGGKMPQIDIQFGINNGELSHIKRGTTLSSIQSKGILSSKGNTSHLKVSEISFRLNASTFKGNFQLAHLNNPDLTAHANCNLDAADLLELLTDKKSEGAKGTVNMELDINGKLDDLFEQQRIRNMSIVGNATISIQDFDIPNSNKHINQLTGKVSLKQDLNLRDIVIESDEGNITVNGTIENASSYIFASGKGHANLNITSDKINVADWVISSNNEQSNKEESFTSRLSVRTKFNTNELVWNKVVAKKVVADISLDEGIAEVHAFEAQLFDGQVNLTAKMVGDFIGAKTLQTNVSCTKVDIQKLFAQLDNLGQQELTSKQLSGKYTGKIEANINWNAQNLLIKENLSAIAEVQITEGAILNYEPIQKLSRFANLEDLKNIRFADLKNTILIHQGTISIPEMELQNNALNLTLSGTQSFAGMLDYKIKLRLSELLKNKRKPADNEFGEVDETGKGMYVFISVKGTTDEPKFSYDKLAVKQKVKADLKKEQETIKEILKKELGVGKENNIKEKKTNSDELEFEEE